MFEPTLPSVGLEDIAGALLRLQTFVRWMPGSVAMFDSDMRYLAYSERWRLDFGRGHDDLHWQSHYAVNPDLPPAWRDAHRRGLDGESLHSDGDRWETTDGRVCWIRWSVTPWRGTDGAIGGIMIEAEDVTRQRTVAAELRLWEQAFAHSTCAIAISDIETRRLRVVNDAFARERGYRPDELVGAPVAQLYPEDCLPQIAEAASRVDAQGHLVLETEHLRRDGSRFPVLADVTTVRGESGAPLLRLGFFTDLSQRRRVDEELEIAAATFDVQESIIITDSRLRIQRVNAAFTRITGYAPNEVIGRTPKLLQSGRHAPAFYADMWSRIAADGFWQGEIVNRRRDGALFSAWMTVSAIRDREGGVRHYIATTSDITAQRDAEARAARLATIDSMTELPNRRWLLERLAHTLADGSRASGFGALLLLDLDHFKHVNDALGLAGGDELLGAVALRLRRCTLPGELPARLSGDEFAVLVDDLGDDAEAAAQRALDCAERLRTAAAAARGARAARAPSCSASVGISVFGAGTTSAAGVLREAEIAMYRAKADGRDRTRLFAPEMQLAVERRHAVWSDLRVGLTRDELTLHFQIQLDRARRAVGAEALLRWAHPNRGLLAPGEFIAVAEESGLIRPLGRWVIEAACARLAAWSREPSLRGLRLAVNVSAPQFREDDFVDHVLHSIARHGVEPSRLKLEVTESMVMDDIAAAAHKLAALRTRGIAIALDDFGTGSSSLAYLTRLPLTELKIDRSFVTALPSSKSDAVVVQTIIAMAKGLGLDVIAEGIETETQLAYLESLDCDAFQGYLLGHPLEAAAFEQRARASLGATRDDAGVALPR